ncbi:RES family NAD+ phosphorylase [Rhodanobacter denitrificans]|uniref:RES family NAD+ phosphorylase n=1 Tax=Rhodanobacter denitrificans TaxID=666685 RepID=UPI001F225819|nr:RES family NAD+ phosphorylase [Rhodanobacter denitrificans]UJJ60603.1 RES family NAD+ phosphorylase [Rhodanobacter denitrificans]
MSVPLWRIGSDTPDYTADDISGAGAKKTGGRWNRPGTPVVYASPSIALACLETIVHLGASSLPLNRFLVRLDVPDAVWKKRITLDPPVGWEAEPAGAVSLTAGDQWLSSMDSALLLVPSVIIPEEFNVLVNPLHAGARRIVVTKLRQFRYDTRLMGK